MVFDRVLIVDEGGAAARNCRLKKWIETKSRRTSDSPVSQDREYSGDLK